MESRTDVQLPQYQCHKVVGALKIRNIHWDNEAVEPGTGARATWVITPEEDGYAPFPVDMKFVDKNKPTGGLPSDLVGGYFVVYADSYRSWSPAQAFEEGYTRI